MNKTALTGAEIEASMGLKVLPMDESLYYISVPSNYFYRHCTKRITEVNIAKRGKTFDPNCCIAWVALHKRECGRNSIAGRIFI
jgi:hypothetical protein